MQAGGRRFDPVCLHHPRPRWRFSAYEGAIPEGGIINGKCLSESGKFSRESNICHWRLSQSVRCSYRLSIFNNLEEVVMDIGSVYEMDVEDIRVVIVSV